MNNYLFFNYAKLKGYTFEFREESVSNSRTFSSESIATEKHIFASFKGRMVGAVQVKSANLPVAVYKEMGFKEKDINGGSPLITYFFINAEEGIRRDVITTGLLLTLQEFASNAGNTFCIGYSHDCFTVELKNSKMRLFEVKHENLVKCTHDIEKLIKNAARLNLNIDKPFIWNVKKPLINFKLIGGKRSKQFDTKQVLSAA